MQRKFSARTSWNVEESSLAHVIRQAREERRELIDLTVANPTVCGFLYDDAAILPRLPCPAGLVYDPDPRGILSARKAVAEYYRDHGANLDPRSLLLTTSTSEAYSFLFRLLCDPGDHVLAARPSYPLFDFLADLDDIQLDSYPLFYDFGWWIDFAVLERKITPRTRAILLVHPNNPTGHATLPAERERLEELCVRHGLALIVDEVFLDYSLGDWIESFASGPHPCLKFVVSGLSKVCALPQMKVGWLAALGPEAPEAMERLEVIADTFLSLNSPVQHALPGWLAGRDTIQQQILARVRSNLEVLRRAGLESLPVQAGWCAVLRISRLPESGELAEALAEQAGVVVHPGEFYGISDSRRIVISLLVEPVLFACGIEKLKRWSEPSELTSCNL